MSYPYPDAPRLLLGDAGRDLLVGGTANDTISGGAGRDTIIAGAGADRIEAGAGNDVITGGYGADYISGGRGADIFRYGTVEEMRGDVIADFSTAQGDKIDLSNLYEGYLEWGVEIWLNFQSGYGRTPDKTMVRVDVDNDGNADLNLTVQAHLSYSDFIF